MKKYNPSARVGSTNTVDKATADDKQHLMPMVQSTVQHFATQPNQPNPIRRIPPSSSPPANWREAIEQLNKRMNKSTSWRPAVSTLYSIERRMELKLDWHEQWDPDPGHITGI